MADRFTLYTAEWVLPVTAPAIEDGAVLVAGDGRIVEVGRHGSFASPPDADLIDLGCAALFPGLVNVHSHPELATFRGLLEDLPFHEWIPALMRTRRLAQATDELDHAAAALWTCAEAVANGMTTLGATEDSGAALGAFRAASLRGVVYFEVFGPDPDDAGRAFDRLRSRIEPARERETELVRVGVSPHAPYSVSDRLFRLTADYALAERLPVAVHAAESETERLLVTAGSGPFAAGLRTRGIETPPRARSTIALLEAARVLETRPLLIHCVHADREDIARLADCDAAVAHCPIANGRLGHGFAPAVEMLEAGVRVGLGTDSVASNNRMDLLEEARVAQLVHRARLGSAGLLPPDRLLRLATLDGARALGLDRITGSLEPGKDADLCAVRLYGIHTTPLYDPTAHLVLSARGSDVVLTVVRGRTLFRDGVHTTIDVAGVRRRIEADAARLRRAREESMR